MHPLAIPRIDTLTCRVCQHPMRFVLQVYAPLDDHDHAFHRTLYLFCCENGSCLNQSGSMAVFRSQLPRRNAFYEYDPAPEPAADAVVEVVETSYAERGVNVRSIKANGEDLRVRWFSSACVE